MSIKTNCCFNLGEDIAYYETIERMELLFTNIKKKKDDLSLFIFYTTQFMKAIRLKNLNKIDHLLQIIEPLYSKLSEDVRKNQDQLITSKILDYYAIMAMYYIETENWAKSINFAKKKFELAEQISSNAEIMWAFCTKKTIYSKKNDYEQIKLVSIESLNYFKGKQNVFFMFQSSLDLAELFIDLAELKQAKHFIDQSQDLELDLSPTTDGILILKCNYWIDRGNLYKYLGQVKEAIFSINQGIDLALKLHKEYNYSRFLSNLYGFLGDIKTDLNEFDEALKLQIQALELRRERNETVPIFESVYQNIRVYLKLQNNNEAKKYLKEFDNLLAKQKSSYYLGVPIDYFRIIFNMAKAFVLISEKSSKGNSEAMTILENILNSSNYLGSSLILNLILPLIELYIQEYRFFQNIEIFQKIQSSIEKVSELAEKSNSISVRIHSLMLKGRFDIVLGKYDEYEESFQTALRLAKEFELKNFELVINNQLLNLHLELSQWQELVKTQSSLLERLEKVELIDYIKECQNTMLL